ncbi:MAG: PilX N-terminal domain-containing pilus assembly protein [Verrucomicrobiota bacterium]
MRERTAMTRNPRSGELGGIAILVTLMLLVLMTVWGVAMSKNALREVILTGTSRQGAQVRNLADTGLEWSIYWMMDDLSNARQVASAGSGAANLQATKLACLATPGIASNYIQHSDMQLSASGVNPIQAFQVKVTYMGSPQEPGTQRELRASSISAASPGSVQLWSVQSDGYLAYSGGPTFIHRREAWFTIPPVK